MRAHDLGHFEDRLIAERERALEDIRKAEQEVEESGREAAGALSRYPTHPADAATDAQETEKDLANMNRESERIARIDEALRVLRNAPEDYGVCERCGRDIAEERMDLVPWTRLCASCAREWESSTGTPAG
jgi:DnaK suppressor protein